MALINDTLIAKYQRWYKERHGRTLGKYTARAHLNRMMGVGGQAKTGGSGSVGRASFGLQPGGGYGHGVVWSTGTLAPEPVARRGSGQGGSPYLDYIKSEAKQQKELIAAARRRREKLEDEARKNARSDKRALQKRTIEIMEGWDKFEGDPPDGYGESLSREEAMREAYRRAVEEQKLFNESTGKTAMVTRETVPSGRREKTPDRSSGGGTIEVTGKKVGKDDATPGTIAVQAAGGAKYKQVIFEPIDPIPKNGPYRGRYQVKTPIPGKNKFKDGKVINSGDLYAATDGEYGVKGAFYDTEEDINREGFGQDEPPVIPPVQVVKAESTTTVPESPDTPPVDYTEDMWLPPEEPERVDEPRKDQLANMTRKRHGRADDVIAGWFKGLAPQASAHAAYDNMPVVDQALPEPVIREEPGSVPMDKEGFFSRSSMLPSRGIQPRENIGPAVTGLGEALKPRGNAWDDAETATGMGREVDQLEALKELHPDWTPEEINEYINYMTDGGIGTSLEWPSADYMGY